MNKSRHAYAWGRSCTWTSHVTHMNESCHTYESDMSNLWVAHIPHIDESCHTHERVMSNAWVSHVTRVSKSYHTRKWVMSHMWMSHVTRMIKEIMSITLIQESCHKSRTNVMSPKRHCTNESVAREGVDGWASGGGLRKTIRRQGQNVGVDLYALCYSDHHLERSEGGKREAG